MTMRKLLMLLFLVLSLELSVAVMIAWMAGKPGEQLLAVSGLQRNRVDRQGSQ
jgi:hypothetical protein